MEEKPGVGDEPQPVPLRYEDAYQYQQIFDSLVQLEAAFDKKLREEQSTSGVALRWEQGLNRKWTAYFHLRNLLDTDARLAIGDELNLVYRGALMQHWAAQGNIPKIPDSHSDEIGLQMKVLYIDVVSLYVIVCLSL